jgi:hypothetical protein
VLGLKALVMMHSSESTGLGCVNVEVGQTVLTIQVVLLLSGLLTVILTVLLEKVLIIHFLLSKPEFRLFL